MQISLNTSESTVDELTALIALCASLGGRLPDVSTATVKDEVEKDEVVRAIQEAVEEIAPPPPPPATEEPPTVDANGIPWDARIHSESKATIADGTWRKRRNVDEATFAAVMAELSDAPVAAAAEDPAPPPPPAAAEEPAPPPPAAEQPAPPPPPADGQFGNFAELVQAVSAIDPTPTYAVLNETAQNFGAATFKDMKDRPESWDMFFDMVKG